MSLKLICEGSVGLTLTNHGCSSTTLMMMTYIPCLWKALNRLSRVIAGEYYGSESSIQRWLLRIAVPPLVWVYRHLVLRINRSLLSPILFPQSTITKLSSAFHINKVQSLGAFTSATCIRYSLYTHNFNHHVSSYDQKDRLGQQSLKHQVESRNDRLRQTIQQSPIRHGWGA